MRSAVIGASIAFAAACGGGARSPTRPPSEQAIQPPRTAARPARVLLFRAAGFPTIDAPALDDSTLDTALAGLPVERATTVAELETRLRERSASTLVLSYGSAFPVAAWTSIREFLRSGGGLAVL